MTTTKNTVSTVAPTFNVDSFLGSLTPVARAAIRTKFTEEVTAQMAKQLGIAPKAEEKVVPKKGPGRPKAEKKEEGPKVEKVKKEKVEGEKRERNTIKLPDGRSGKKRIEENDAVNPGMKPKEVEKKFEEEFGGAFKLPKGYVSVVRNQAKVAAEKAAK
jgi:hypothetical protein